MHGEIKVNEQVIAAWSAVNNGETADGGTEYLCTIIGYDTKGYPYNKSWSLVSFSTDPLLVTSDIMESAFRRLNALHKQA